MDPTDPTPPDAAPLDQPVTVEPDPQPVDPSTEPTTEQLEAVDPVEEHDLLADSDEVTSPGNVAAPDDEAAAPDDEAVDPAADDEDSADDDSIVEPHPEVIEPNPEAIPAEAPAQAPAAEAKPEKPKKPKKPSGPDPAEIVRRIGKTNEQALAYVLNPDPKLTRLSRKAKEALITEIPPVTAGALLGPEALARHFIASAAAGRYRDLFFLWDLFRARPDECKPVLAERQRALERARQTFSTAVKLGLTGQSERVAQDVARAQGLIWTWMREVLVGELKAVGLRPRIMAALLAREPDLDIPLPSDPNDRWLAEAAAAKTEGPLPPAMDALLAANVERLPATVATLSQVSEQYPERLEALVDRIDLQSENIGGMLAWARDHGMAERVRTRIEAQVEEASARGRAEGLSAWQAWRDRGVVLELPEALRAPTIEGLDLARPESADVIAQLISNGAAIDPQAELEQLAAKNRQLAEKAYESFVCAGLDVHLPLALEGNPIVRDGTRCPACQAWTWVRPGHERRCPKRAEAETVAS